MKKKISLSALACAALLSSQAHAVLVDTSLWTKENSPATNGYTPTWTSVGGNQAIQDTNTDGSLISNFSYTGDFTFSGTLRPTTAAFNDDDILGIVFGWQDAANHYRLGWEQGGYFDVPTGANGMWLVKEVGGVSTILYENSSSFWSDNTDYAFSAGRNGNQISFSLGGITQSFIDTTFMSGQVGFYTESQTAIFSGLSSVPQAPGQVPEPSILALMGLGFAGLGVARRRKS